MAFISNALAIVGFIILFVIIVWGLFHIINLSGTSIGSIFPSTPKVSVTAPKSAVAGEPISVSWQYSGKEAGSYSFLYQCEKGFAFATGVGTALENIPCGEAINVGSSTNATIVPVFTTKPATSSMQASLTVIFATDAGSRIQGDASVTVTTNAAPTASVASNAQPSTNLSASKISATQPKKSPITAPTKRVIALVPHAASGPADLAVRMIMVGVIDASSGALIPREPISPAEIVGVEFDVANVGGSASGSWNFTAQLPTGYQGYLYTSPAQISLMPGEHIVNVLRFAPNMRPGTITVTADPFGQVYDADRSNNIAVTQI